MKIKKSRPITIVGNWKMNNTRRESAALINDIQKLLDTNNPDSPPKKHDVRVIVAPSYFSMVGVRNKIEQLHSNIKLASQNMFFENSGAYTGSVSGKMVKDAGCDYAIIGHSERSRLGYMTSESINKRILAAFKNQLYPIFCVGENLQERESNQLETVITKHLSIGLTEVIDTMIPFIIIAYEPVWAIGTGHSATPQQAEEAHKVIRKFLDCTFGEKISQRVTVIYGGSVNEKNCESFFECENIDGAIIGAVSLKAKEFTNIVKIAETFEILE